MVKIGVVLGSKDSSFAKDPHYSMEIRYFEALEKAGAVAVPVIYSNIEKQLNELDGLLLPGGDFSTPADYYVEHKNNPYKDNGSWFNAFMQAGKFALDNNMPVLGICAGMQTLAVLLDGKLKMGLEGHRLEDNKQIAHSIKIKEDSHLFDIFNSFEIEVNSIHSEAVAEVNGNIDIVAVTDEGVIEAIESKEHDFVLGVQWHPECLVDHENQEQLKMFEYFVNKCRM